MLILTCSAQYSATYNGPADVIAAQNLPSSSSTKAASKPRKAKKPAPISSGHSSPSQSPSQPTSPIALATNQMQQQQHMSLQQPHASESPEMQQQFFRPQHPQRPASFDFSSLPSAASYCASPYATDPAAMEYYGDASGYNSMAPDIRTNQLLAAHHQHSRSYSDMSGHVRALNLGEQRAGMRRPRNVFTGSSGFLGPSSMPTTPSTSAFTFAPRQDFFASISESAFDSVIEQPRRPSSADSNMLPLSQRIHPDLLEEQGD